MKEREFGLAGQTILYYTCSVVSATVLCVYRRVYMLHCVDMI